jgi:hypothetical protein
MRFKKYLNLQEEIELRDLNGDFLKKALRLKTFSITSKDLQFLEHKKEIQFVVRTTWFPDLDLNSTISSTKFDKVAHNELLSKLKSSDKTNAGNLIHYSMPGIGPGEFMFYFMYDKLTVGGGSSKGVDLKLGSNTAELKSIKVSVSGRSKWVPQGWISGFFMGGAVDTSALANKIHVEMQKQGIKKGGSGSGLEYAGGAMAELKQKSPTKYAQFEREFGRLANTYFSKETVVFINNTSTQSSYGEILHVGPVNARNVRMEVITQSKIKPMVKI